MNIEFNTRIFESAPFFYQIGVDCYNKLTANLAYDDKCIYIVSPMVVNLSFAAELFLKAMLGTAVAGKIHSLKSLLDLIPENERNAIIQLTKKQYEKNTKKELSTNEFYKLLSSIENSFVDWRYYYEKSNNINIQFLLAFSGILNTLSKAIIDTKNLSNKLKD